MEPYDDRFVGRVLEPWNQHDVGGTNTMSTTMSTAHWR
jgi:hypothetical protein